MTSITSHMLKFDPELVPASLRGLDIKAVMHCQMVPAQPLQQDLMLLLLQFSNGSLWLVTVAPFGLTPCTWECIYDPRPAACVRLSQLIDLRGERLVIETINRFNEQTLSLRGYCVTKITSQGDYILMQSADGPLRTITSSDDVFNGLVEFVGENLE